MRLTRLVVCFGLLVVSLASAQLLTRTQPWDSAELAMVPRINPRDVVRRVRSACSTPRTIDPANPSSDGGEFLIDTSISLVPAPHMQSSPAVAFDGVNFLVVWTDDRVSGGSVIYGARVTPQGAVLDPAGIAISHGGRPTLAFDGANFLVVWEYGDIHGARVTPSGVVLDTAGIQVSPAGGNQGTPAIAFDGTNFLVAWQDNRTGTAEIHGTRVTPAGIVLDTAGFAISHGTGGEGFPSLAFDGVDFLVVWQDSRNSANDIYGARVTPGGVVRDSAGIAISTAVDDQYRPGIAFDGANFLVAWEDCRTSKAADIYGTRVTPAGGVLDPSGIAISTTGGRKWDLAVAFDGADFLVVWDNGHHSGIDGDIYGARVTPQGTLLDPSGIAISQAAYDKCDAAVGFGGASFLVAWGDYLSGEVGGINAARVTPQGTVLDSAGFVISQAASDQDCPAVGFDGTNFLVTWQEDSNGSGRDIYGVLVSPQGTVLDSGGIITPEAAHDPCNPAVGFDGTDFLVVWQDNRDSGSTSDILGTRVTRQGAVLDSAGFVISQAVGNQVSPAVGYDGANFFVVWEDVRSGSSDIYGARVTPAGVVLDTSGMVISQASRSQGFPAVGFDGANSLVVWEDDRSVTGGNIYGARVTPLGVVLDTAGIAISPTWGYKWAPSIAFDGANFLAVWSYRNSGNRGIYGARVTPQGTVLDSAGVVISEGASQQLSPNVAFDGANFLAAWQDDRIGGEYDIYGARVTPEGTVFERGSAVRQPGDQQRPRLCCGNGNQMLLVYQGWAGAVSGKGYNSYRIWGKVNPNPAVADMAKPEVRSPNNGATLVYGMLYLPAHTSPSTSVLIDISGRKVMDLRPGSNDVRALAPGVYFVREAHAQAEAQAVRKVVLTR